MWTSVVIRNGYLRDHLPVCFDSRFHWKSKEEVQDVTETLEILDVEVPNMFVELL